MKMKEILTDIIIKLVIFIQKLTKFLIIFS